MLRPSGQTKLDQFSGKSIEELCLKSPMATGLSESRNLSPQGGEIFYSDATCLPICPRKKR